MTSVRAEDVQPGMVLMAGFPGLRRPCVVEWVERIDTDAIRVHFRVHFRDCYHTVDHGYLFDRTDEG